MPPAAEPEHVATAGEAAEPARILAAAAEHLPEIVAIHRRSFPKSLLTFLGPEAVRRYYDWLLTGPHDACALVAMKGEQTVGFCFAGRFRGAVTGCLRKNRAFFAGRLLLRPWAVLNPEFRQRIVRGLQLLWPRRRAREAAAVPLAAPAGQRFGVLAIAVDPACQGAGAGKALMAAATAEAVHRGCERMNLTVDPENRRAVRFYEGLGWKRVAEDGVWRGRMERDLKSQDGA